MWKRWGKWKARMAARERRERKKINSRPHIPSSPPFRFDCRIVSRYCRAELIAIRIFLRLEVREMIIQDHVESFTAIFLIIQNRQVHLPVGSHKGDFFARFLHVRSMKTIPPGSIRNQGRDRDFAALRRRGNGIQNLRSKKSRRWKWREGTQRTQERGTLRRWGKFGHERLRQ